MRHLSAALTAVVFLLLSFSSISAQFVELESTPQSTEDVLPAPKFYIAAVGDFPDGYFKDVNVAAGTSITLQYAVGNFGEVDVDLTVAKISALSGTNGGFYPAEEDAPEEQATAWMDLERTEFSLDPGQQELGDFTVTVPGNTPPGQYMAGLLVRTTEPVAVAGTNQFTQTIQYTISLSIIVPGDLNGDFSLGEPAISLRENERRLSIPITNTGTYLVRPSGTLQLLIEDGEVAHEVPVNLGSIYMAHSTQIWVSIPSQMPAGEYILRLKLTDADSGSSATLEDVRVVVPEMANESGVYISSSTIMPNDEDLVFANVDIALNNGGPQIAATDVNLEVLRDGELIDTFPVATNQVMLEGENTYTTRYIPADMWEPGTYTFRISVFAVSPDGSERTELLSGDLFVEIVVP